jgi:hypothetical protein
MAAHGDLACQRGAIFLTFSLSILMTEILHESSPAAKPLLE